MRLDWPSATPCCGCSKDLHWNVSLVAKNLGLSRNTLYRRMKRYGINPAR